MKKLGLIGMLFFFGYCKEPVTDYTDNFTGLNSCNGAEQEILISFKEKGLIGEVTNIRCELIFNGERFRLKPIEDYTEDTWPKIYYVKALFPHTTEARYRFEVTYDLTGTFGGEDKVIYLPKIEKENGVRSLGWIQYTTEDKFTDEDGNGELDGYLNRLNWIEPEGLINYVEVADRFDHLETEGIGKLGPNTPRRVIYIDEDLIVGTDPVEILIPFDIGNNAPEGISERNVTIDRIRVEEVGDNGISDDLDIFFRDPENSLVVSSGVIEGNVIPGQQIRHFLMKYNSGALLQGTDTIRSSFRVYIDRDGDCVYGPIWVEMGISD